MSPPSIGEFGAGDELRFVGQEIDAQLRHLRGLAEAAKRNVARELAACDLRPAGLRQDRSIIGPSRNAGCTELQRTGGLSRAPCSATDLVKSRTPPLDAL